VLWNDGTACNCGRDLPRDQPEFAFVREIDYVSGASFLIRKSFWDSIGGFDERYENAYCEDSDLAMTARAAGMRVLYQPRSEIVHFENKSYDAEGANRRLSMQQANIRRLREKWRDILSHDHLPPEAPEFAGIARAERTASPEALTRRSRGSLNILYFSPFPSHPSNHGNQATIQQFGQFFQNLGHNVHFAVLNSNLLTPSALELMQDCWDTVDVVPNSQALLSNGDPIPFDGWYEEGLGEQIRELCIKYDVDVVFCSYVFQSKLLEFVPAYVLKVIDTHDKMGDRYEMLRQNGQPLEFFSCTPEEEGAYMRRADVVVARRSEEARYFDSVSGKPTAIVVPHVEEAQFLDKTAANVRNVGIVASANLINLAIVRECLEAIERQLGGRRCPFTVHIAGQLKDMVAELAPRDAAIFRNPWVRMHGFVPDIVQFYRNVDLVLSPVTMGTGINVKTVQAMAYGMPLLTTSCGSKGIETGDPMHGHADLDALAASLMHLTEQPEELARLATVSRARFTSFYDSASRAIRDVFRHPKLLNPTPSQSVL
jgi:glycosyltransferase involved in cell wall biosynthesis